MMTSEEIYDLVAYFMKEDAGLPCRYDELSFEQRTLIDALVENFESVAKRTQRPRGHPCLSEQNRLFHL